MFKAELIDIGNSGLVTELKTSVETLPEAELIIKEVISKYLQTIDVELVYDDDLVYEVISRGRSMGVVSITSL